MKPTIKALLAFVISMISVNGHAMMEFPFCPAGGPPGWINYFNYKRDQNNWRHLNYYPTAYHRKYYYYSVDPNQVNYGNHPTDQSGSDNTGRQYPDHNIFNR